MVRSRTPPFRRHNREKQGLTEGYAPRRHLVSQRPSTEYPRRMGRPTGRPAEHTHGSSADEPQLNGARARAA